MKYAHLSGSKCVLKKKKKSSSPIFSSEWLHLYIFTDIHNAQHFRNLEVKL